MKIFVSIFTIICSVSIVLAQGFSANASQRPSRALELPEISIVGDLGGKVSDDKADTDKNRLLINGVELALQGYLYPEMWGNVIIAAHEHDGEIAFELEEAYVKFLRVVNGLQLTVGKKLINFGKVNSVHQHHRPYADQPQVLSNFFGDHGLLAEGANLSFLLPAPFFVQLDAGAWKIRPHEHHAEEIKVAGLVDSEGNPVDEILIPGECGDEFGLADETYTGRLWVSFPFGKKLELDMGVSAAKALGSHFEHHLDKAKVVGGDLTLRFWPGAHSRLIFQNEYMRLKREVPLGIMRRGGFYSYLGYRLNKYYTLGARYDYSEDAFPHFDKSGTKSVSESEETQSASFIITKHLTETTMLRAQYKHYFDLGDNRAVNEGYLQVVFGIGPHSHPLE